MYQIEKVLNNNSVLVHDSHGETMILMGKGIGFGKKAQDQMEDHPNLEKFYLAGSNERGNTFDMINDVDPIYIEVAAQIIALAKSEFGEVDTNILLPLADHIAFSIERIKQKMEISNPFTDEIRLLYTKEYEVACKGKRIIEERCHYEINEDEVGYITLHIHSALSDDKVSESMQVAIVIQESIQQVERDFSMHIDVNSMSYIRLMNHMKFLLLRIRNEEPLKLDVSDFVKDKFPYAYKTACTICEKLKKIYKKEIEDIEIGYLALHIERVRTSELDK